MKLASALKSTFVTDARKPRKILAGPFRGIVMNLSLQSQAQMYIGLFERETHRWIRRFSRNLCSAADVGAAYGEYTLFFALKTSAKNVYAFEPDQECLPAFRDSLGLNPKGDWSHKIIASSVFVGDSDTGNTMTLDSLIDSIETPCFVKVDVDGCVEAVLKGARRLNALRDIRWLIETHSRPLEDACVRILSDAGFKTKIVKNAWWRILIPEQRPSEHNRWLVAWKP